MFLRLLISLLIVSASALGLKGQAEVLDVTGTWTVVFKGSLRTTLVLQQSGTRVTGTLDPKDGTRPQVQGRLEGRTLILSRETGVETVQHYRVTVEGDRFAGTFNNVGKYPDEGSFTGSREAAKAPDLDVTGTWTVVFKGSLRTTLVLQQSGTRVTGTLDPKDGTKPQVQGRLEGRTLILSRETGVETVQHYRVTIEGDRFSGTFNNVGKYPDEGSFTGSR